MSIQPAPTRLHGDSPSAWRGRSLSPSAWRVAFPEPMLAELGDALASAPLADEVLRGPQRLQAPSACAAFMDTIRDRLNHGPGFVVATGLPVDDWGDDRTRTAIALTAPLLAPLMHQTHSGDVLYAVRDTGAQYRPGVRRSITNAPQPFHTDGPWPAAPPEFIGLHCLRPSSSGGESRCISIDALLDDLEAQAPEHYQRLSRDLPWHRQGEHRSDESPVAHHPLWWLENGRRQARLYTDYVHSGARLLGHALDLPATHALDALEELSTEQARWLTFTLGQGDVVWVNNRCCAHGRTGFDASGGKRHLIRTWYRTGRDPRIDA